MIAQSNGSSWLALGSGINSFVDAVSVRANELNAAGSLTMAGAEVSACLARANLAGGIPDSDGDGLLDSWEIAHFPFRDAHMPPMRSTARK